MTMNAKERLMRIPELTIDPRCFVQDERYEKYVNELNNFIDTIPTFLDRMIDATDNSEFNKLEQQIASICTLLVTIYADGLATKFTKEYITSKKPSDELEVLIENISLLTSSLSIDIQFALSARKISQSKIESVNAKPMILAVDNSAIFLQTIRRLIGNEQEFDLRCLKSGEEALWFCKKDTPDFFLLDIEMPEMTGYELAVELREAGQKAPIIFITANSSRRCVEQAIEVGAIGMLMKPFKKDRVLQKLKAYL
jgi:CheY-like chemotaxis protein